MKKVGEVYTIDQYGNKATVLEYRTAGLVGPVVTVTTEAGVFHFMEQWFDKLIEEANMSDKVSKDNIIKNFRNYISHGGTIEEVFRFLLSEHEICIEDLEYAEICEEPELPSVIYAVAGTMSNDEVLNVVESLFERATFDGDTSLMPQVRQIKKLVKQVYKMMKEEEKCFSN